MNQAVANIIRKHIEGLDFVDKIAGLVAPLTFDIRSSNNETVQKTFPVACCVSADDCKEGAYNELMPDSAYKTVIYFEDGGVSFERKEGNWKYYRSKLRLVCWINVAKILGDTCKEGSACTLSTHLIAEIIRVLPDFPAHHNPFNNVYSEITGQVVRTPSIFAAYTYDEKHAQYLMYPYDYFALEIDTVFGLCLTGTGTYSSACTGYIQDLATPVATAGTSITKNSFVANWNLVQGATGYIIEVATDLAFQSIIIDEDVDNSVSVSITGLIGGTNYYYRVRAYSDTDTSDNSNTILTQTSAVIFSDYFLPAKDELNSMYTELHLHGVGNFISPVPYLTSSEFNNANIWNHDFNNGLQNTYPKGSTGNGVRACRAFTSTISYSLRDIGPAGGLIFWKSGNNYLEASPSDQSTSHAWSNITNLSVGTTDTIIGTGQANTTAIINQVGHTDSAAKLCEDLIVDNS